MTQPFEIPAILGGPSFGNSNSKSLDTKEGPSASNEFKNGAEISSEEALEAEPALGKKEGSKKAGILEETQLIEPSTQAFTQQLEAEGTRKQDNNIELKATNEEPASQLDEDFSFASSSIFGRARPLIPFSTQHSAENTVTQKVGGFSFDDFDENVARKTIWVGSSNQPSESINKARNKDSNTQEKEKALDNSQPSDDPFSTAKLSGSSLFERMKMRKNKATTASIKSGASASNIVTVDALETTTVNLANTTQALSISSPPAKSVTATSSSTKPTPNFDSSPDLDLDLDLDLSTTTNIAFSSSLSFSSSMFARSVQPKNPTAVTSSGKVISLSRKPPKKNRYLDRNEPTPATMDHEDIQASVEERNPGLKLNKYDTRNQFGIPVYIFKAQAERESHRKEAEEKMRREEQEKNKLLQEHGIENMNGDTVLLDNTLTNGCTQLLTEKYRPTTWLDLVGPEKTHRRLLKWLLQWSPIVYGDSMNIGNAEKTNKHGGYNSLAIRDILGRPQKKILLIHGPPGIGKTTVAHVIAGHAKYDVIEINASDERSASTVKDRIRTATSSHSLMGSGKPSCIVADEVEGAAEGGFVRALIDLLEKDERALSSIERIVGRENAEKMEPRSILRRIKNDRNKFRAETIASESSSGTTINHNNRGNKKQNTSQKILENLLMRPIIAVCNDVYAHSLRALRPYAEVVSYNRTSPHTLVDTLQQICKKENFHVDIKELTQMAIDSECDLRSCLNMLQFGWQNETASIEDSKASANSQNGQKKDMSKSWSSVVMRIFQQLRNLRNGAGSRGTSLLQMSASGIKTKHDEFESVLRDIYACGEHDRIVTGAFLAFPHMQYHEDMFSKNIAFGDWLFFHERIEKLIYSGDSQMAAGQYYGYTALAAHSLFNNTGNNKGFPSMTGNSRQNSHVSLSEHEFFETLKNSRDLLNSIHKTLSINSPDIYKLFNKSELITIMIPYLLNLVNPKIPNGFASSSSRSFSKSTKSSTTSMSTFKEETAAKIERTVQVLLEFGLEYVLGKTETLTDGKVVGIGSMAYILEPPIEKLVIFDETRQKEASVGTFDVRQKVNIEIMKKPKAMLEPFQKVSVTTSSIANGKSKAAGSVTKKKRDGDGLESQNKNKKSKTVHGEMDGDQDDEDDDEEMADMGGNKPKLGGLLAFGFSNEENPKKNNNYNKPTEVKEQKELAGGTDPETRIWVQYHEGLSNAVRRNLTWERIWI